MRAFVLLSIIALAAGDSRIEQQGDCLVDGAEAVSDLMDSTMFIWASIARCGHGGEEIKCEISISSAIQSVNSMINVILRAVDKCGDLQGEHKDCGMAAGTLTKSIAGLAAASGGIAQKCPGQFDHAAHGVNWNHAAGALCVVNIKSTAKSLFKAIKALLKVKKSCKDGTSRKCTSNSLKIVAAFAGLGEYLAGTIGQCTTANNGDALCSQQISMLLHHAAKVAMAGTDLSRKCEVKDAPALAPALPDIMEVQVPRLYEEEQNDGENTSITSPNVLLGAFLPVTAIVSFVGGRFYANHRSQVTQTREFMSDIE